MRQGLPRWLRLFFALAMLALCMIMAFQLVHQNQLRSQITDLQNRIETTQGRLAKQQMEYDKYTAELPAVQAELSRIAPEAEAAAARANELKAQRKALRSERTASAQALADLQAQAQAANILTSADAQTLTAQLDEAILLLTQACEALQN
jgi:chromosome segregation ATPase